MDRFARAKKRKSTDIRNDQREKGAFPIRMFFPEDRDAAIMAGSENHAAWRNPANEAVATPGSFAPVSETDYPTYLWGAQRMASKGFLVTKTGCLIPDKRWCEKGKGSTAKGYQLMFGAMYAATTIPLKKGSEGADKAAELQHGCHNHACCNTDHIWIEPAYRNRKRNYCGRDGDGCTCGGEPPCLEPYSSSHSSKGSASTGDIEEADLCQSWEEVDLALNKHLYALKWEPSTWELLEASKAGHASQKKALEGAAKRRKASRPADENTPGATGQGRKKQKTTESRSLENSKIANRKAREARARDQAWSCARKAAARAAKNFSRRHVAEFQASCSQKMCAESLENASTEMAAEVEKAARVAYLNHLQVPLE